VVLAERWAEELAASGVTVNAMHPGWADTGGVRDSLPRFHRLTKAVLRTPAEGADTIVWLAASPAAAGRSGEFFFDRRSVRTDWLPFTRVSDDERASLWNTCEGLS
jgi:NAD(P)-dependent dehydrogenase (short-subunit alcohol dehydrogenase family)